jgi:lysophospholipase L1-like esterase
MCIPWDRTLDETRFSAVVDHFGRPRDKYRIETPRLVIGRHMAENNIPYLDLHDVFTARENPLDAYGREDTHFSPTGHAWTAEALIQRLKPLLSGKTGEQS